MKTFELILTKDKITGEEWRQMIMSIAQHTKGIKPFSLAVSFQENLIRYFLVSKHDLSQLSSGIEGAIITRSKEADLKLVDKQEEFEKIMFLKIPTGGTLIDLKERYKVQESLDLKLVYFDIQRLGKRMAAKMSSYFVVGNINKVCKQQLAVLPVHLLEIDYSINTTYLRKTPPKYLSIEKTLHMLTTDAANAVFSIDAFPYFSQDYYLNLNSYDFDKHSFIIGATGTGKSKLIDLIIDRISSNINSSQYRVLVIDPHAALAEDLSHIPNSKVINFSGEATQLFPDGAADISATTELTTTLFKSLVAEQANPRLERVLRFTLYVLLTAQAMSLQMLKTFLTELDTRNQLLEHVKNYVPSNVVKFFGSDFNDIRAQHYNEAILPLVSLVDEMQMQPSMVGQEGASLAKTIQDNFLTVFSLNKVSMGEKVVKTVAGLLIQQIFLLAQSRAFGQKVILFIDEVSVVQNPALASILAEARKFGLTVILTQQYFGQIEKGLQNAILSNVYNYYIFKVSEEDARVFEGNMEMTIAEEILLAEKEKGIKEQDIRAKIMVELDPRQCIIRVSCRGQLLPCVVGRTVDVPVRKLDPNVKPVELEPYKSAKLPPKFDQNSIGPDAVPELTKYQAADIVQQEKEQQTVTEPAHGLSLAELLKKSSTSRPKAKR